MVVTPGLRMREGDGFREGHASAFSDLGDILVFRSGRFMMFIYYFLSHVIICIILYLLNVTNFFQI